MTGDLRTGYDRAPSWSPDGRKIAFMCEGTSSGGSSEICVVGARGTGLRHLTDNDLDDSQPAWSPGGDEIVFVRSSVAGSSLMVISAEGDSEQEIAMKPSAIATPSFSPAGDRVLFGWLGKGGLSNDIYSISTDGDGETNLTNSLEHENLTAGAWAPSGRRIVFDRFNDARENYEIFTMTASGTDIDRVGTITGGSASWSPDGRRLVFTRLVRHTRMQLFKVSRGGRMLTRLSTRDSYSPNWQSRP